MKSIATDCFASEKGWNSVFIFIIIISIAILLNIPLLFSPNYKLPILFIDYSNHINLIYKNDNQLFFWWAVKYQSHSWFETILCSLSDPDCHEGKMVFRLIVPIIHKIVGNAFNVYLVQILIGIIFLKQVYAWLREYKFNQIYILIFLIGFVSCYAGHAFLFDVRPYGDAFAYLFIMLAFRTRSYLLFSVYVQLAFWTDERSIISIAYFPIVWIIERNINDHQIKKNIFTMLFNTSTCILVINVLTYILVRDTLSKVYDVKVNFSQVGFERFIANPKMYIFGLINSFKAYYAIIWIWLALQYKRKNIICMLLILFIIIVHTIISFTVMDVNRSFAYIFPLILVLTVDTFRSLEEPFTTRLLLGLTLTNLLFPLRHIELIKTALDSF